MASDELNDRQKSVTAEGAARSSDPAPASAASAALGPEFQALSVWKYDLCVEDRVLVEMPQGAEILHVGNQTGEIDRITIWARVSTNVPNVAREILVRGTGHPAPDAPYIGTVVGALVWHVFDGGEK